MVIQAHPRLLLDAAIEHGHTLIVRVDDTGYGLDSLLKMQHGSPVGGELLDHVVEHGLGRLNRISDNCVFDLPMYQAARGPPHLGR